jgi:fructokinase
VSFDPNVRLELWDSPRRARETILECLHLADVVKVSGDELEFLTGTSEPASACRRLREAGPVLAVATLGAGGCVFDTPGHAGHVSPVPVEAVDSLGAGDAFVAGMLATLADRSERSLLSDPQRLSRALRFANAVGAITTTQYGAIPALPTRAQVEQLLETAA